MQATRPTRRRTSGRSMRSTARAARSEGESTLGEAVLVEPDEGSAGRAAVIGSSPLVSRSLSVVRNSRWIQAHRLSNLSCPPGSLHRLRRDAVVFTIVYHFCQYASMHIC